MRIFFTQKNSGMKIETRVPGVRFKSGAGFTLIETLVAISLLAIAIVAPMSLTTQSLAAAYYARDQVTAFFLAQEALEGVRSVRDGNILLNALGTPTDLMTGIPSTTGQPFTVDSHTVPVTMTLCNGTCPPLQTDGTFYGYNSGWTPTNFTRSVAATFVPGSSNNEIKVAVTISWQTAAYQVRTFTLSENMYRWISDTAGAAISISASPSNIVSGGAETVSVSNNDPFASADDWVGMALASDPNACNDSLATKQYLNGSATNPPGLPMSSANLNFTMNGGTGNWVFTFYANNGCTVKATSNTVTVN